MMTPAGDDDLTDGGIQGSLSARHPSYSSNAASPLFRVFCKGMASRQVAVLAVAVHGPPGDVLLTRHKPVVGFVGGGDGEVLLEVMALLEGLHAALGLGITTVEVITDHRMLHNLMLRICHPTWEKLADLTNQALLVQKKFEQFEISLVPKRQVSHVVKLAREAIGVEIAKSGAAGVGSSKERRETCSICLEDTRVSKIHAVEGCAHRFCFSCMKEHVRVKLLHKILPACPRHGCITMLTVEGSKVFLPPPLLEMMAQRIREAQIPPSERLYCPYPKCSALMSLSEVKRASCSKYKTLRKCVRCEGSLCMSCKAPWHERMSCHEYKRRYLHGGSEDAMLVKLVKRQRWQQCKKCKHVIELAVGCYHMTCVCGYQFCYRCGKEWNRDKSSCSCPVGGGRRRIWCLPLPASTCWGRMRR